MGVMGRRLDLARDRGGTIQQNIPSNNQRHVRIENKLRVVVFGFQIQYNFNPLSPLRLGRPYSNLSPCSALLLLCCDRIATAAAYSGTEAELVLRTTSP